MKSISTINVTLISVIAWISRTILSLQGVENGIFSICSLAFISIRAPIFTCFQPIYPWDLLLAGVSRQLAKPIVHVLASFSIVSIVQLAASRGSNLIRPISKHDGIYNPRREQRRTHSMLQLLSSHPRLRWNRTFQIEQQRQRRHSKFTISGQFNLSTSSEEDGSRRRLCSPGPPWRSS